MPVKANAFHALQFPILGCICGDHQHDNHSCQHMKTVEACEGVIKRPKAAGGKHESFMDIPRPFESLDYQKNGSAQCRETQKFCGLGSVLGVGCLVRQYGAQTGCE